MVRNFQYIFYAVKCLQSEVFNVAQSSAFVLTIYITVNDSHSIQVLIHKISYQRETKKVIFKKA